MKNLGYYNGHYDLIENMTVPMNDRACWFGDGVYDAGPCVNYKIFALDEHIDRFFRSARAMDIEIPVSKEGLADLLNSLVRKLDSANQFVYFQVTRGTAPREHSYEPGPGNLWVTLKPSELNDGSVPIAVITCKDMRYFHCNIKTINLLPSVLASQKAKNACCDEAVFLRPGSRVTECSHSNVHIVKNGMLYTAPTDNLILPGIARKHLLSACERLSIPYREEPYYLPDLLDADEIIVTSSSKPCLRVDSCDGKPVGGNDPEIFEALRREVVQEIYDACR